jgi:DNA polymerase-1
MSTPRKLLHVVDGSGYIFRAYYAIRSLSTASGEPTNAVMGFTTMLLRILEVDRPELMAITFDEGRRSFRNDIYPEYKANRSAPPEDLPPQIPWIHQVVESFRIPLFKVATHEADDVIATLVRIALEQDLDVRLITGDKDLMQLVSDRVTVWEPMREIHYGPAEVEAKHGVPPSKIADMLALAGDTSDNVPGVKGCGPKTAAKLLGEHGDLDGVLKAAAEGRVKGKMGERLVADAELARLSRRLVQLDDHTPIEVDLEALRYTGPDLERQRELFDRLEFRRLLDRAAATAYAGSPAPTPTAPPPPSESIGSLGRLEHGGYAILRDVESIARWVDKARAAGRVGLSLEPLGHQLVDAPIVGLALAVAEGEAAYVPTGHTEAALEGGPQLDVESALAALAPLLGDADVAKACTSAKPWYALSRRFGVPLAGVRFDASLASYLLDAEDRYDDGAPIAHGPDDGPHGAGDVARKFLGLDTLARSRLTGRGRDKRAMPAVPVSEAGPFVAERAEVALRAADRLHPELESAGVWSVMTDLELPLAPILAEMELSGIRVDVGLLASMKETFAAEIDRLEAKCYELAGHEFKINSPPQLRTVLFEELGLKIIKRTKTGPSTDHQVLEELSSLHELPAAILDWRQVNKLQSTYVETLPRQVAPSTGRVHTVLSQTVAATGRLSASDPNLQNIPIRTELGRGLRRAFVPASGMAFVSVDYSQIELRVLAHFCQDPVLLGAFRDGVDVHTRTASVLFEIDPAEVTFEQRTQAKAVNFGVLYGMGPVRLSRELQIPRRVASQFVKDYFDRQPGIRVFLDQTLEGARADGFVRTLLGRRRWVRDIDSRNRGARAAAERVAVNTPIQGSAADLIKLAMIRVRARLAEEQPEARLILQVHDELLLEAPLARAEAVAALVKQEMEEAYPLEVPLVAEAHVGGNWDEAH